MASTAYLWSAAALLVAALAVGNPLRPGVVADAPTATAPAPLAVDALDRSAVRLLNASPSPAAVSLVRHGGAPAEAGFAPCPDAALAPLVVGAEASAAHGTVWVLRDGRRFALGAAPTGLPLVELAPAAK
jgi:hypothetical protein